MTDKICYWDADAKEQKERDATPEEQAEINARRNAQPTKEQINAPILAQISKLDLKRIRPLAEGDTEYLAQLNAQIINLRNTLVK